MQFNRDDSLQMNRIVTLPVPLFPTRAQKVKRKREMGTIVLIQGSTQPAAEKHEEMKLIWTQIIITMQTPSSLWGNRHFSDGAA